jgi:hypothetical protein
MNKNSVGDCSQTLAQGEYGICWFMSILHAIFYSEPMRKYVEPTIKQLKQYTNIGVVKFVVDMYERQHTNNQQACYSTLHFMNNLLNYSKNQTTYNVSQRSFLILKKLINDDILTIEDDYNDLFNYVFGINRYDNIQINKIVGGQPHEYILPFLNEFLQQQQLLQVELDYRSTDDVDEVIRNSDSFTTALQTVCVQVDRWSQSGFGFTPSILFISCCLARTIKPPEKLTIGANSYILASAMLGVAFTYSDNHVYGHAITGIRCNGKTYLIDSMETGKVYSGDWINMRDKLIDSYEKDLKKGAQDKGFRVLPESSDIVDTYIYVIEQQIGGSKSSKKLATYLEKNAVVLRKPRLVRKANRQIIA